MSGYDSICCFSGNKISPKKKVLWEITNRCNLNCSFCHRTVDGYEECAYESAKGILQCLSLARVSKLIFSGGEPLCHPNLFQIMAEAKQLGFEIDLCTNATLINDKIICSMVEILDEVSVSVDSADEITHDLCRGKNGSWRKTIQNIKMMTDNGLEVHAISILNSKTIEKMDETVHLLRDLGAHSMSFIGEIPIGKGDNPLFDQMKQEYLQNKISQLRADYSDFPINTKQVFNNGFDMCLAGRCTFGLNCHGVLFPCILRRDIVGIDILNSSESVLKNAFSGNYNWQSTFTPNGSGVCPGSRAINSILEG